MALIFIGSSLVFLLLVMLGNRTLYLFDTLLDIGKLLLKVVRDQAIEFIDKFFLFCQWEVMCIPERCQRLNSIRSFEDTRFLRPLSERRIDSLAGRLRIDGTFSFSQ